MAAKLLTWLGIVLIVLGFVLAFLRDWQSNGLVLIPFGFFVLLIATVARMQRP